jgi:acyl-coenzyme A synthetase/AMP-(fatty) acid ligase
VGNFVRDVVALLPGNRPALIERTHGGGRRTHLPADLVERGRRLAGTLAGLGVRRGDVVLTLIGSRVEWVEALLGCFGAGYIVLPCTEQLRGADLRLRLDVAQPAAVVADERNRSVLEDVAPQCPVLLVPDSAVYAAEPAAYADLAPGDDCLITFTSGTAGPPKAVVHAQRYLLGQQLQGTHWLGASPDDIVWCTAGTGWSKSARNSVVAPWVRGATAVLHDARFDPAERLAVASEEGVTVWCMAPTEYRVIAARAQPQPMPAIRSLVAAGEALDVATIETWRTATGVVIRDGYGQTETGQVTANPVGVPPRHGSMGRPLPGVRAWVDDGELVIDPATVPTFFSRYLGEQPHAGPWRTGDRVEVTDDGYFSFVARADDVIVSAGYRIGPFEVESVLATHPAVAECAVVGSPDAERGEVVRAVVVLRAGYAAGELLAAELADHVKTRTAPYKYPRIVDFAEELPKTASGKVRRTELR